MKRIPFSLAVAVALFFLYAPPAHAYVDPGAGSLLLQLILGGLGGIVIAAKLLWNRIRGRGKHDA